MEFLKKIIVQKIIEYNKIALFFHDIPDFDTLGSCFALKHFIKNMFPSKEVHLIGLDILNPVYAKNFFEFDQTYINNNFLKDSLGIILDTADEKRIFTQRHKFCKETIRIDHHPQVESIANIEWIDPTQASTTTMVASLLLSWNSKGITNHIANYLYAGIVTDTNRFLYGNLTSEIFLIISKLINPEFEFKKLYNVLYQKNLPEVMFESYILSKAKFLPKYNFCYVLLPKNSFNKFGVELRMSMVQLLSNIKGYKIWASFYYDDNYKKWRGSLRSSEYPINQIAEKYSGGGHKYAAGFTLNRKKEYKHLINDIIEYVKTLKK